MYLHESRMGLSHRKVGVLAAALVGLLIASLLAVGPSAIAGTNRKCNGVDATWVGTNGADVYRGTPGNDVIVSLGGDDDISGGAGHDLICAGDGADTVRGNGGLDMVFGGAGNDHILGGSGHDRLHGEDGQDKIEGGVGPDFVYGGPGHDDLRGGSENDVLNAGRNRDHVLGGPGFDTCVGEELLLCGARPARTDYLHLSWTKADETSFKQLMYLRRELKKGDSGAPYTGPITDAALNRSAGITCEAGCLSVSHNYEKFEVTVTYRSGLRNVITANGTVKVVVPPPPPPASPPSVGSLSQPTGFSRASGATQKNFEDARDAFIEANHDNEEAKMNLNEMHQEAITKSDNGTLTSEDMDRFIGAMKNRSETRKELLRTGEEYENAKNELENEISESEHHEGNGQQNGNVDGPSNDGSGGCEGNCAGDGGGNGQNNGNVDGPSNDGSGGCEGNCGSGGADNDDANQDDGETMLA